MYRGTNGVMISLRAPRLNPNERPTDIEGVTKVSPKSTPAFLALVLVLAAALMGCGATQKTTADAGMTDLEKELETRQQRIENLENSIADMKSNLESHEQALADTQRELDAARSSATSSSVAADGSALPPAKVGECYAKVWVQPVYNTETVRVLKKEASERIEVIPARYEWVEEKVLEKEASTKLEVIPATYEWVEEQMLVKAASKRVEQVPATYEWVEEKVLDTPAHTVWKKGRGAIEKVDNATGEIMCLVEVPAVYKTVKKRVVKTPATTRDIEIPAEYKTVKKRVVKTPATTRQVEIPATYKTVKVRKLVEAEKVQRIPVEAEYETVTKRNLVSEGKMEWRPVLCETNMSGNVILRMQQALMDKGYDPGPVDGVYGKLTRSAMTRYQKDNGLASGQLTLTTLKSLNVQI